MRRGKGLVDAIRQVQSRPDLPADRQQSVELLQFISRWALAPVEFAAFLPEEPEANAFRLIGSLIFVC